MQQKLQVAPEAIFFIPPPINELNKNYYQQLSNPDNPVQHATQSYFCYNELFRLDHSNFAFQNQLITQRLKDHLRAINRTIYAKMTEHLESLSGQSSLQGLKTSTESIIRQQILKFMEICQSVKRQEARRDICTIMTKQSKLIRERTAQLQSQLQKVKDNLKENANDSRMFLKKQ